MRKISFFKTTFVFINILTILACKTKIDQQFDTENEQIKTEFKAQSEKFIKENAEKLSDKEMLKSLDSITEEFTINKNKKLAVKFIKSESGLKRLNFLKKYFNRQEIRTLLKEVPEKLKTDTNYVALEKHCNTK